MSEITYRPGDIVPASGVYRIEHHLHRLMHEATLEQGIRFPLCRTCRAGVTFVLVRAVPSQVVPFRSTDILQEYPAPEAKGKSAV